jgi:hypothetical protein
MGKAGRGVPEGASAKQERDAGLRTSDLGDLGVNYLDAGRLKEALPLMEEPTSVSFNFMKRWTRRTTERSGGRNWTRPKGLLTNSYNFEE